MIQSAKPRGSKGYSGSRPDALRQHFMNAHIDKG